MEAALNVAPIRPIFTVVEPITRPLVSWWPASTMRPSSTSAHTESTFANRNLSCRLSSCTSSAPWTRSGSGASQCESRRSIPAFSAPLRESEGIQDIDRAVASTRILLTSGEAQVPMPELIRAGSQPQRTERTTARAFRCPRD